MSNFKLITELREGNFLVLYHRTEKKEFMTSIAKNGFQPGAGAMYGYGLYTNYNIDSVMGKKGGGYQEETYGEYIFKFKYPLSEKKILILNEELRKSIHGSNSKIEDIVNFFEKEEDKNIVFEIIDMYKSYLNKGFWRTSDIAHKYKDFISKNFDAVCFNGSTDGDVCVIYEHLDAIPFSYTKTSNYKFIKSKNGKVWRTSTFARLRNGGLYNFTKKNGIKFSIDKDIFTVLGCDLFVNNKKAEEVIDKIERGLKEEPVSDANGTPNYLERFLNKYSYQKNVDNGVKRYSINVVELTDIVSFDISMYNFEKNVFDKFYIFYDNNTDEWHVTMHGEKEIIDGRKSNDLVFAGKEVINSSTSEKKERESIFFINTLLNGNEMSAVGKVGLFIFNVYGEILFEKLKRDVAKFKRTKRLFGSILNFKDSNLISIRSKKDMSLYKEMCDRIETGDENFRVFLSIENIDNEKIYVDEKFIYSKIIVKSCNNIDVEAPNLCVINVINSDSVRIDVYNQIDEGSYIEINLNSSENFKLSPEVKKIPFLKINNSTIEKDILHRVESLFVYKFKESQKSLYRDKLVNKDTFFQNIIARFKNGDKHLSTYNEINFDEINSDIIDFVIDNPQVFNRGNSDFIEIDGSLIKSNADVKFLFSICSGIRKIGINIKNRKKVNVTPFIKIGIENILISSCEKIYSDGVSENAEDFTIYVYDSEQLELDLDASRQSYSIKIIDDLKKLIVNSGENPKLLDIKANGINNIEINNVIFDVPCLSLKNIADDLVLNISGSENSLAFYILSRVLLYQKWDSYKNILINCENTMFDPEKFGEWENEFEWQAMRNDFDNIKNLHIKFKNTLLRFNNNNQSFVSDTYEEGRGQVLSFYAVIQSHINDAIEKMEINDSYLDIYPAYQYIFNDINYDYDKITFFGTAFHIDYLGDIKTLNLAPSKDLLTVHDKREKCESEKINIKGSGLIEIYSDYEGVLKCYNIDKNASLLLNCSVEDLGVLKDFFTKYKKQIQKVNSKGISFDNPSLSEIHISPMIDNIDNIDFLGSAVGIFPMERDGKRINFNDVSNISKLTSERDNYITFSNCKNINIAYKRRYESDFLFHDCEDILLDKDFFSERTSIKIYDHQSGKSFYGYEIKELKGFSISNFVSLDEIDKANDTNFLGK